MALIAGIYSSIYNGQAIDRTAGRVTGGTMQKTGQGARAGKSGAARRARKAARKANGKA